MIVKSVKKEQHSELNSHETNMKWIDQLQQALSKKDEALSRKDEALSKSREHIKKLEKIIESNNIII